MKRKGMGDKSIHGSRVQLSEPSPELLGLQVMKVRAHCSQRVHRGNDAAGIL